jgi:hypothetical protein
MTHQSHLFRIIPFLLSSIMLSGCASIFGPSQNECLQANYAQLGLRDGQLGRLPDTINQYQNACTQFGIKVDRQAYKTGYDQGLLEYCNSSNAINLGRAGGEYIPVCPGEKESDFFNHYMLGLKYFCNADYGFKSGKSGQLKNKNCQIGSFTQYDESYQRGYSLYLINARKLAIKDSLRELDAELYKLKTDGTDYAHKQHELQREQIFLQQEYNALIAKEVEMNYPITYSAARELRD